MLIGESLRYGQTDTPTREGEVVNYLEEIHNIPTPYVGMRVYCKQTGKTYTITSLASEIIGGEKVFNKVGTFEAEVKEVTWTNVGNVSNMNDFVEAGVYEIKGEHTRIDDNLPILNIGGGHTFHARLEVLDSSIAPEGQSDDVCITQKLTLSNRVAGDGDVYIRTGRGASKEAITWETWGKLQQNIEVGQVANLDNLIDNGIYSGVWVNGHLNNYPLTFVCVVINDYFIGTSPRRISQFLYGLSKLDGSTLYKTRVWDDSKDKWSDWEILNKNEISSMITDGGEVDVTDKLLSDGLLYLAYQPVMKWNIVYKAVYAADSVPELDTGNKIKSHINSKKTRDNDKVYLYIKIENRHFIIDCNIHTTNGILSYRYTIKDFDSAGERVCVSADMITL